MDGTGHNLKTIADVMAEERDVVAFLRKSAIVPIGGEKAAGAKGETKDSGCYNTIGLALSGGGIRSAAFCTGALQGLAAHKLIDKIDYLSTVSGGGYIGSSLSVALAKGDKSFPFLSTSKGEKDDTLAMRHLRNNANYLKFGDPRAMVVNILVYLRGLVANSLLVLPVLLGLAAFTLLWNRDYASLSKAEIPLLWIPKFITDFGPFAFSFLALIVACGCLVFWARHRSGNGTVELQSPWLKPTAIIIALTLIFAFMELQPVLVKMMLRNKLSAGDLYTPFIDRFTAWIAPFLAIVTFASRYLGDMISTGEQERGWRAFLKKHASTLLLWIAGLALPVLLWLFYLRLVYWGYEFPTYSGETDAAILGIGPIAENESSKALIPRSILLAILYSIAAYAAARVWLTFSPNGNSLHRLYRERLSNAFCFSVIDDAVQLQPNITFSELKQRPLHLVNAALNVQHSERVNERGRNADFFSFSPVALGSPATGYVLLKNLETLPSHANADLDLATAVAISGAAASSNMGSETIKPMSFTLALLNVRLGFWYPNPRMIAGEPCDKPRSYFISEALGLLSDRMELVYLTDGGHIENLGVYELLRRRCELVIAVDAEADRDMNFSSLMRLQRYARIDLGARIDLKWSEIKKTSKAAQKNGTEPQSGPHCAVGRIEYSNGGEGILLYVKASVTGDENDYVRDYNRRYSDFPHETTGDQFFSEEQFEAYRALGFHAVNETLSGKSKVQTSHGELESLRDTDAKGFGVKRLCELLAFKKHPGAASSKSQD